MKEVKIQRSTVKSQKWGAALCVVLLVGLPLAGQVAKEANAQCQSPEGRKAVAAALDAPDREQTQRAGELPKTMGVTPGMTVADVGTGSAICCHFSARQWVRRGKSSPRTFSTITSPRPGSAAKAST